MSDAIDIIMVTYNRLELTKKSINSILERTKIPYRLIVVDNLSTDGVRNFLLELWKKGKIQEIILNNDNIGLEKALNLGLNKVESEYFVSTDNDIIASEGWLSRLKDLIEKNPDYGAIGCRPQVLVGVGNIFKTDKEVAESICGSHLRIFRTEVIKKIGGWTDRFDNDGRGNEEHDICGKLKREGYKTGYAKDIWCYHQFENEHWGYKDEGYRMGRMLEKAPQDVEYNPITCEPKIKSNE